MPDLTTSSDIDAFMQSADNAAARTSLGLGTAATSASTDFATAAQGAKADTALQPAEVKSSSFTAANDGVYVVVASATVTDPSPVEGKGFLVIVRNGTATVGGTGYSTAGQEIRRIFHSGGWANYVEVLSDDSRLSDARTPTAHASSHVTGGTDKIRDASASQDGLMTTAYASKLDGIEAGADVTDATNVAAAGAVMESDYDANTILAATSDNTPAALTVGEATMVGRQTGGAIAAIARVSAGEITAGTETALRAFSPKDVADMAGTHGGGGGGSGWVLIDEQEVTSAQAAVTFDSVFSSTYDQYMLSVYDAKCSSSGNHMNVSWRDGTTDVTDATSGSAQLFQASGLFTVGNSNSAGFGHKISHTSRTVTGANASLSGWAIIQPRLDNPKVIAFETRHIDSTPSNEPNLLRGYSFMSNNTVMSGCKFAFASGNITQGRFAIYGLTKV